MCTISIPFASVNAQQTAQNPFRRQIDFSAHLEAAISPGCSGSRPRCSEGVEKPLPLAELEIAAPGDDDQVLAVSEALDKLAAQHKLEAELVKLRYFVGMTSDEAAEALGISPRTAKYYWTHARAWLFREIVRVH